MPVLRAILIAAGVLAAGGAIVALACGAPFPTVVWLAGIALMLTLGVIFERIHYKRLSPDTPGVGFVATAERFVDPETGKLVEVHVHPASGERAYVVVGLPPEA